MEFNMNKLGVTPEHNVLYITGLPGSGKTTLSKKISDEYGSAGIIHLDAYAEGNEEEQNSEFNKFIECNCVIGDLLRSAVKHDEKLEDFSQLIEQFGKAQYPHNKIVVVEGFQIFLGWLHEDDSFYFDKCLIIIDIPVQTAIAQMAKRDGLIEDEVFKRLDDYKRMNYDFIKFKEKFLRR